MGHDYYIWYYMVHWLVSRKQRNCLSFVNERIRLMVIKYITHLRVNQSNEMKFSDHHKVVKKFDKQSL